MLIERTTKGDTMDRSTFIGWTGPEYHNYRVFYRANGYRSETIVRAESENAARERMATFPGCLEVTSVMKERR